MPVTSIRTTTAWRTVLGTVALTLLPLMGGAEEVAVGDSLPPINLTEIQVEPAAIGEFQLKDHAGRAFDRQRLTQGWHLMMFGFTHCPDVCPVHLTFLDRAWDRLLDAGYTAEAMPQVVMVSVDPKRDSLDRLKKYVTHFNDQFIGVTGEPEQIKALEDAMGAGHRIFSEDAEGNYDVMHASAIYMINPQARAVARIRPPFQAGKLAAAYHGMRGGAPQ